MRGWLERHGGVAWISVVALFLAACLPEGCERRPRGPVEIVVKLREEGKRLTTETENGQPVLYYGAAPLRIFERLPDRHELRIRQSFPEFSRRWQREIAWRAGRHDSAAVEILADLAATCQAAPLPDRQRVARLVARWRGDRTAVGADTAGVVAIKLLLQGLSADVPVDSARALAFLAAVTADGAVMGERDPLAVPAVLSLLGHCPGVADSDSVAVLGFARRIRDLARAERIGLRDSLAVASWVRLLAGDDAFGEPEAPAAVDLWLRIRVMDRRVRIDRLLAELGRISEVDTAFVAHPVAAVAPSGTAPASGGGSIALAVIGCSRNDVARAQGVSGEVQAYQTAAPVGIDAEHAWTVEGGDGGKARVIVLDHGYAPHDDLPAVELIGVMPAGLPTTDLSHGTKTLGVLAAIKNNIEIQGTVLGVRELCFTSVRGEASHESDIAAALDRASTRVEGDLSGALADIVIIEAQLLNGDGGGSGGFSCGCGGSAASGSEVPSLLPVEADGDIFDLIHELVFQYGATVVEAAGNGEGRLEVEVDSGAIMVGAGEPDTHARRSSSNYGDRVDCQGWGRDVRSTAINEDHDPDYDDFDGTSLAAAMVGAVAASYQSAYLARYYSVMAPTQLRTLLRDDVEHGTPQAGGGGERIGPLPNLKALLEFD